MICYERSAGYVQVSKDQFISVLIEATQATKEWFLQHKKIIFVAYSELNRVRRVQVAIMHA